MIYTNKNFGSCYYDRFDWPYNDRWDSTVTPNLGYAPPLFFRDTFPSDGEVIDYARGGLVSSNLDALGTKFISQTIPTNPVVDGSVALAELFREGLPSMIGSAFLKNRAGFFKDLGSEYLNYEFGWKPLVSDLKNASKAIIESEKILKTLEKYSGHDLRRKRLLPDEKWTNAVYRQDIQPSGIPFTVTSPPRYYESERTVRQQWFSGCYVYHFEPAKMTELSRIATQARLLYGIKLTPDVLWNLAPWSWLVDWFANVGPILSNVSAFQNDGLVLKYGYVMEKTTRTMNRSTNMGSLYAPVLRSYNHPAVCYDEFLTEVKRRQKATPFGFGLNTAAFSGRQWAILGALGLTRGPKTL